MDVSRRVWVGALLFAAVCVYTVSVSPESTLFLTSVLLPPQPCRLSIFTFLVLEFCMEFCSTLRNTRQSTPDRTATGTHAQWHMTVCSVEKGGTDLNHNSRYILCFSGFLALLLLLENRYTLLI